MRRFITNQQLWIETKYIENHNIGVNKRWLEAMTNCEHIMNMPQLRAIKQNERLNSITIDEIKSIKKKISKETKECIQKCKKERIKSAVEQRDKLEDEDPKAWFTKIKGNYKGKVEISFLSKIHNGSSTIIDDKEDINMEIEQYYASLFSKHTNNNISKNTPWIKTTQRETHKLGYPTAHILPDLSMKHGLLPPGTS